MRWVQEALRCIRGVGEGESSEKDEAEDMEEEPLEHTQGSTMQDEHQTGQFVSMRSSDSLQSPTTSPLAARALFTAPSGDGPRSADRRQPRGKLARKQKTASKMVDQSI